MKETSFEHVVVEEDVEDRVTLLIHDLSMSRDDGVAAAGRLLKEINPLLHRFTDDCRARRLSPGIVITGMTRAFLGEIAGFVISAAKTTHEQEALQKFKAYVDVYLDELIESPTIREQVAAIKKRQGR